MEGCRANRTGDLVTLPPAPPPIDAHIMNLIQLAVREDLGDPAAPLHGDRTVELSIPADQKVTARIVARSPGIIAGTPLLPAILGEYEPNEPLTSCVIQTADASHVIANQSIAEFSGPARTLLSAERVMLNFLCHLSGVATLTRRFVDAVSPVSATNEGRPFICDTRKTMPGFRALEKYAVRCGGGVNHRMGLYDGVMLKDNHLAALRDRLGEGGAGTLAQLTGKIREELDPAILLWLEVDTLEQLKEALHVSRGGDGRRGADIILLDNFTTKQMAEAVKLRDKAAAVQAKLKKPGGKMLLEASGGVTLDTVLAVAETGVDRISIGALTHSAPILDLSMEFLS